VKDLKLARRYAKALYQAALEENEVESVVETVRDLLLPLIDDTTFRLFWFSGVVPQPRQLELVDSTFESAPGTVRHFLRLLIEKRRVSILKDVLELILVLHDEETGVIRATLVTAVELNADELKPFEELLYKQFSGTVILSHEVDPSLIGGFRLQYGDKIIDGSVERSLSEIKRKLSA